MIFDLRFKRASSHSDVWLDRWMHHQRQNRSLCARRSNNKTTSHYLRGIWGCLLNYKKPDNWLDLEFVFTEKGQTDNFHPFPIWGRQNKPFWWSEEDGHCESSIVAKSSERRTEVYSEDYQVLLCVNLPFTAGQYTHRTYTGRRRNCRDAAKLYDQIKRKLHCKSSYRVSNIVNKSHTNRYKSDL